MYSSSISQNSIYCNQTGNIKATNSPVTSAAQNPISTSFKGESSPIQAQQPIQTAPTLRTTLSTKDEQDKYIQLFSNLGKKERQNLELLLRAGILLNTNSNDKTSTLDSLHKILTTPRAKGLDPKVVLKETVNTIANPFIITQNFGDIPEYYVKDILTKAKPNSKNPKDVINEQTINVPNSSACVSASIEFNLASQMPAEFARFAEALTSPKMAVDKTIDLKNLTDNTLDSVYLLNLFELPYDMKDFNKAKLTLAPDKNAYIRAQIQNNDKDYMERSVVDVLMQSTFMNVGSQQTYDSLTDLSGSKFNEDSKGLIEFEKTFTESIVEDKNKISVTYQTLDENAKLTGYTKDFDSIKKDILDSLAMGESVIIGYTQLDGSKKVINGHEITIIGAGKDKNGKLIFICNDTDDNNPNPITYPADYIIPMIHHAGLPQKIAEKNMQTTDLWKEGLEQYKSAKAS